MLTQRQRIAVLYGGPSAERAVSLESGTAVAQALASRGHDVQLIDPVEQPIASVVWTRYDCAFIALHGTYGEDGCVQRELDQLAVPYTGSSADVSELAFDKWAAKQVFDECDVPTPWGKLVRDLTDVGEAAEEIGFPLVVKPCRQGSSVGVTVVQHPMHLAAAAEECFRHDTRGLVEEAIQGEEWTVGLIDRRCLTPIRIKPAREFYDYQAKYEDDHTQYQPADSRTDPALVSALQSIARDACEAIGTSGIARVDFRVDPAGNPWVLEVNTVPGFTSHSLIPKAAQAEGIEPGALFESVLPAAAQKRIAC